MLYSLLNSVFLLHPACSIYTVQQRYKHRVFTVSNQIKSNAGVGWRDPPSDRHEPRSISGEDRDPVYNWDQTTLRLIIQRELFISQPRLGIYYFFVVDSVCLSVHLYVCLSRCSFKSILLSLFLDGIKPFFGCHLSMWHSTKRSSIFIYNVIHSFFLFLPCDAMRCTVSVIVILSVRPSVRLSHSWTVSTRFDLRSWFLHHMVAPSF